MTRERHIAIIRRIGKVDLETATRVADRFLEELELEREETDPMVVDFPERPHVDKLAPPPVSERTSVIPAKDVKVEPIRASASATEPVSTTKYWNEIDLSAYLEAQIPANINVMVEGLKEPLTLARDITPLVGLNMVKVSYSQNGAARPTASTRNQLGQTVERMAIETMVSETFSCFEENQPLELKMSKIRASAREAFKPRPEKIVSRTPIQAGSLSWNASTPHEEV